MVIVLAEMDHHYNAPQLHFDGGAAYRVFCLVNVAMYRRNVNTVLRHYHFLGIYTHIIILEQQRKHTF